MSSRRTALASGLALAAAALGLACSEAVEPATVDLPHTPAPEGASAVAAEVRVGPEVEWASGAIASARHTVVSSRVLARIEEVRVTAGSTVAEGDVVVVLDARDLRARVDEADEALRSARARQDLAERERKRIEALFAEGVAAQSALDRARSQLDAARADVSGRAAALEQARAALSFSSLRAPVGGRVVDRLAERGDTATPGTPLLRIYDPASLRVEVPVRESLAVGLALGQELDVEVPSLPLAARGAIEEIVPFADPGARTLLVKVGFRARDERILAGMFARVAIPSGTARRIVVPRSAVREVGQLRYVDVAVGDDASERRLVTLGAEEPPDQVEVLSGVREGERVWAAPSSR